MELKYSAKSEISDSTAVLIVPLWNWNKLYDYQEEGVRSSNCTFMELKLWSLILRLLNFLSSNCTFMELKSLSSNRERVKRKVLIVPLWNWNWKTLAFSVSLLGSNCTFMELKFSKVLGKGQFRTCSNCTFMELKSLCSSTKKSTTSSSNCTFMELKWRLVDRRHLLTSSNCTFMELKYK